MPGLKHLPAMIRSRLRLKNVVGTLAFYLVFKLFFSARLTAEQKNYDLRLQEEVSGEELERDLDKFKQANNILHPKEEYHQFDDDEILIPDGKLSDEVLDYEEEEENEEDADEDTLELVNNKSGDDQKEQLVKERQEDYPVMDNPGGIDKFIHGPDVEEEDKEDFVRKKMDKDQEDLEEEEELHDNYDSKALGDSVNARPDADNLNNKMKDLNALQKIKNSLDNEDAALDEQNSEQDQHEAFHDNIIGNGIEESDNANDFKNGHKALNGIKNDKIENDEVAIKKLDKNQRKKNKKETNKEKKSEKQNQKIDKKEVIHQDIAILEKNKKENRMKANVKKNKMKTKEKGKKNINEKKLVETGEHVQSKPEYEENLIETENRSNKKRVKETGKDKDNQNAKETLERGHEKVKKNKKKKIVPNAKESIEKEYEEKNSLDKQEKVPKDKFPGEKFSGKHKKAKQGAAKEKKAKSKEEDKNVRKNSDKEEIHVEGKILQNQKADKKKVIENQGAGRRMEKDINKSKKRDNDKQKEKEDKDDYGKLEDRVLQDHQEDKKKVLENQGAGRKVKKAKSRDHNHRVE